MSSLQANRDPRWLVLGAGGMLASDLAVELRGRQVNALSHAELDITSFSAVREAIAQLRPNVVVNTAAYTAVDRAEKDEASAFAVNAVGAANVARACAQTGARLVYPSTDYVFDGAGQTPYAEDAVIAPRSAYGRSKAAGEWAVRTYLPDDSYIVRTAWLYGAGGRNFVTTMIDLEPVKDTIEVVDDQRGQPTWTLDLAAAIVRLVDSGAPAGTYHGTSSGHTTWFGLAQAIFELLDADPRRVRSTTSAQFARPAPRPAYSVLGHEGWSRVGLPALPAWRSSLAQAVAVLTSAPSDPRALEG